MVERQRQAALIRTIRPGIGHEWTVLGESALRCLLPDGEDELDPDVLARLERNYAARPLVAALEQRWAHYDADELHRCGHTEVEHLIVNGTLAPAKELPCWREPLSWALPVVFWREATGTLMGWVPGLDLSVHAPDRDQLALIAEREIDAHLTREGLRNNLERLSFLLPEADLAIHMAEAAFEVRSLRERLQERTEQQHLRALPEVGRRWLVEQTDPALSQDRVVTDIYDRLTMQRPRSLLVVGPSGRGKTALIDAALARWPEAGFPGAWRLSGTRLVAGQSGFGQWQERCQQVIDEARKAGPLLLLGHLWELAGVGRSTHNSQSIASFLRPAIERGDILTIAEATPEERRRLEQDDPGLLQAFDLVEVGPLDPADHQPILTAVWNQRRRRQADLLTPAVLDLIDHLHQRFAGHSALPGRSLHFIDYWLRRDEQPDGDAIHARFCEEAGLPRELIDPAVPFVATTTRAWFGERIVGQDAAVDAVIDALVTIKADVGRGEGPLATLFFAGPTGVGKTALSRALATWVFGSDDRLVRFDCSEFADPVSATRLIGGVGGSEGLLTRQVRATPFGVLLFDEIEKADPLVFDFLLQVIGEGRATDRAGRLADCRSTIVLFTSNLGALAAGRSVPGFSVADADHAEPYRDALANHFRPEFLGRIDHIVPFRHLDGDTIRFLVDREIDLLGRRSGIRERGLQIAITDQACSTLAAAGTDTAYGARPLRRAVENLLLSPLAEALALASDTAATIQVEAPTDRAAPCTITLQEPTDHQEGEQTGLDRLRQQRRSVQALGSGPVVLGLRNEITALERLLQGSRSRQPDRLATSRRIADVTPVLDRWRDLLAHCESLEDDGLTAYLSDEAWQLPESEHTAIDDQLDEIGTDLYQTAFLASTTWIGMSYGEDRERHAWLIDQVVELAFRKEHTLELTVWTWADPDPTGDNRTAWQDRVVRPNRTQTGSTIAADLLSHADVDHWLATGIRLSGRLAKPFWDGECGLHLFPHPSKADRRVRTLLQASDKAIEPDVACRRKSFLQGSYPRRRAYDPNNNALADHGEGTGTMTYQRGPLIDAVLDQADRALRQTLHKVLLG